MGTRGPPSRFALQNAQHGPRSRLCQARPATSRHPDLTLAPSLRPGGSGRLLAQPLAAAEAPPAPEAGWGEAEVSGREGEVAGTRAGSSLGGEGAEKSGSPNRSLPGTSEKGTSHCARMCAHSQSTVHARAHIQVHIVHVCTHMLIHMDTQPVSAHACHIQVPMVHMCMCMLTHMQAQAHVVRTCTRMLTHGPHMHISWRRGAVLDPLEQALPLAGLVTEQGREGQGGGGAVPSVPGRQPARQPQPVPKELWAGPARTSPGSGWTPSQPQGPRPGAQPGCLSASWTGKQVLGLPGPPALSLLHLCVLMWPCQQGAGPVPHVRLPFTTGCKWGLNY